MSRRNIFGIYDLEDPSFNLFAFRFHIFKIRLGTFYRRIKFFYSQLELFKINAVCHWIAFRYWIVTGEIMQEYLDLLEDQQYNE